MANHQSNQHSNQHSNQVVNQGVNQHYEETDFVILNQDLALKSLLFALLFYVVSSPVIYDYLNRNLPKGLEVLAIQSVMFALSFYLINLYL